ncbi:MAG: transposase [bacterium]
MRSRYKFIEKEAIYFVTCTIVEWLPVFTHGKYFEILIDSLKFCQHHKDLEIYAFVLLDNHLHLVVFGPELSLIVGSFKKFTARQVINSLKKDHKDWLLTELAFYKKRYKTKSDYQVWQEGSHPQLIISDEMLIQKIEYIHYNPVKRGLVDKPEHWRYSSARNYFLGDHSIIEINRLPL